MIDVSIKGDDEVTQALKEIQDAQKIIRLVASKLRGFGVEVTVYPDRWKKPLTAGTVSGLNEG